MPRKRKTPQVSAVPSVLVVESVQVVKTTNNRDSSRCSEIRDRDSQSDSESSTDDSSEDEHGQAVTPSVDLQIMKTISLLKKKMRLFMTLRYTSLGQLMTTLTLIILTVHS